MCKLSKYHSVFYTYQHIGKMLLLVSESLSLLEFAVVDQHRVKVNINITEDCSK